MIYYSTSVYDLTYLVDLKELQFLTRLYEIEDIFNRANNPLACPIGFVHICAKYIDILCVTMAIPLQGSLRSGAEDEVIDNFVLWLSELACGNLESSSFVAIDMQAPKSACFVVSDLNDELRGDAW